jgi:hypothetical protein
MSRVTSYGSGPSSSAQNSSTYRKSSGLFDMFRSSTSTKILLRGAVCEISLFYFPLKSLTCSRSMCNTILSLSATSVGQSLPHSLLVYTHDRTMQSVYTKNLPLPLSNTLTLTSMPSLRPTTKNYAESFHERFLGKKTCWAHTDGKSSATKRTC